jgi:site-specific recombinase XerC
VRKRVSHGRRYRGGALAGLVDQFFAARRSRKGSPHTVKTYRNNLAAVCGYLAAIHGTDVAAVR